MLESNFRQFAVNRLNQLRFVYTHFKSCDQSLDEISLDFSYFAPCKVVPCVQK